MTTAVPASRPRAHLTGPVAFVLSGGASLGAAQVGMLQALRDAGVTADLFVGSSVGALNAAVCASDPVHGIDRLAQIWGGIRGDQIFPLRPLRLVTSLAGTSSLVSEAGLNRLVGRHLPPLLIEDLPTALLLVATDQLDGTAVVLRNGPLGEAVLASAAIPAVFPAVRRGNTVLVDGGLAANVPTLQAVDAGARTVVVLEASGPCRLTRSPRGVLEPILAAVHVLTRSQADAQTARAAASALVLYLPTPCTTRTSPLDFTGSAALMSAAREAVTAFLDDLPSSLPATGLVGLPHRHAPTDGVGAGHLSAR